jgi:hypothetical protein
LELPEWLNADAYRNHRDSVGYCYQNGWITCLISTIEPFFQSWAENRLDDEDAELVDSGRGHEHIELDGERLSISNYYNELSDRTTVDNDLHAEGSNNPTEVLNELQQLRNAALHRPGYFESGPVTEDGRFGSYNQNEFETSPEEVIGLYEEILEIPEEESITNFELGAAESRFYPDGDSNAFYSDSQIDEPLQADTDEQNPNGINHLNSLASGMYHSINNPYLHETNRRGYTTRYNPAQPASATLIYNWLETRIPDIIENEYESQNLDMNLLPDEPDSMNRVSLSDWVDEGIMSRIDVLPSSAYPNALEDPKQRLEELEEIRDNLAHNVNFYGGIEDLDVRDNIWHGYEIMHLISDRTGYRTNEFELFGEEAEQQANSRPYMTMSERLTRW